jgi:hypothetical protein
MVGQCGEAKNTQPRKGSAMNWFEVLRIILIVPTTICVIGLFSVLMADIRQERHR